MYSYYKLTSRSDNGKIVRVNNETHDEYVFNTDTNLWEKDVIMIMYFYPESDTYDMYEEINESDLQKLNILIV